jgi:hypothetical protein
VRQQAGQLRRARLLGQAPCLFGTGALPHLTPATPTGTSQDPGRVNARSNSATGTTRERP